MQDPHKEIALRIKRSHHFINNFIKLLGDPMKKSTQRAKMGSLREVTFR